MVGPDYLRWGYPDWFHLVSGGLELAAALLLPSMATRLFGVALGGAIMLAAMATIICHREYHRAMPPLVVLMLLAIVGDAALGHRSLSSISRRPAAGKLWLTK